METNLEQRINEQLWRLDGHKNMASFIFNQICMPDYSIRNMQESREKAVYVVQELIIKKYEEEDAIGWRYWNSVREELYKL